MFNTVNLWVRGAAAASRRRFAGWMLGPVGRAADLKLDRDALLALTAREQARASATSPDKTGTKANRLTPARLTVIEGGLSSGKRIATSETPGQRPPPGLTGIPGGLEKAS